MPITSHTDQSKQLTTFVATGEVSFSDIIRALKPFFEGHATKNVLWDFREAQPDVDNLTENIDKLAEHSDKERELRSTGKTALVGTKDLMYGLLRMYETFANIHSLAHSVKAFRTIEEAYQWLDEL